MPVRRTNMATASLEIGDTTWIFTFMGLDSTKACGNVQRDAWKYNTVSDRWYPIDSVPGPNGRIAASATGFRGKIYLIGGYEVSSNCGEFTSPRVDIYDPVTDSWSLGAAPPTKMDDQVQDVWNDSLIVVISGWSTNTNTRRVQMYDAVRDTWLLATPITGPGLFGHAGAISGNSILYLDGVRISGINFVLTNEVWRGEINPLDPAQITWTSLGQHPGDKVYRGGGFSFGDRVLFTGGTDNAYNIDGVGYNNVPCVESGRTFGYDLVNETWEEYASNPDSVMDVREVVKVNDNEFYVVGGMEANQRVTDKVSVFIVDTVLVNREPPAPEKTTWIYPTVFDGYVRISLPADFRLPANLDVFQGNGLRVWSREITQRESFLDLPALPEGAYVFRIFNGSQKFGQILFQK